MRTNPVIMAVIAATAIPLAVSAQPGKVARIVKPSDLKAMSLDQMKKDADKYLGEMRTMVTDVLKGLAEARKAGDPQTVKCVNNTLSTIKGLMRLSEQNGIGLSESVIANDRSKAQHEYVKMTIARNKMIELHAQAKGCGGPDVESAFEGVVDLERLFDEDLPFEDAKAGLDLPLIILAMPPSSSPFF